MTVITFEVATIADAVRKAALVAPTTRGEAWDKAHGLMFHVNPAEEHALTLRSTNLLMFQTEWVTALAAEGASTTWRLPSGPLSAVIAKIPAGGGRTVTFEEKDGKVEITSGKGFRCRMNMPRPDNYPVWRIFDPDELSPVPGLGRRIKLVEWAAATTATNMAYTGVRLDGKVALATDTYRAAMIPCEIDHLANPVTIPTGTLSTILKDESPALVGQGDDGLLHCMPDDWTQVSIRTIGVPWPGKVMSVLKPVFDEMIEVDRDELLRCVQVAWALDQNNRVPLLSLYIGRGELSCINESEEYGLLRDLVEISGANHPRVEYKFNPKNLVETLGSMPAKTVTLGYTQPGLSRFLYLNGGDGYEAWIGRTQPPKKGVSSA